MWPGAGAAWQQRRRATRRGAWAGRGWTARRSGWFFRTGGVSRVQPGSAEFGPERYDPPQRAERAAGRGRTRRLVDQPPGPLLVAGPGRLLGQGEQRGRDAGLEVEFAAQPQR